MAAPFSAQRLVGRQPANGSDGTRRAKRLVIYLTALGHSGELHSAGLRGLWADYGDVRWAQYPLFSPEPFPGMLLDLLANEVLGLTEIRALRRGELPAYDDVLIIGASMGALLAGDLIHRLWSRGYKGRIKAILVKPAHHSGQRMFPWRAVLGEPLLEDAVRAHPERYNEHRRYLRASAGKEARRKEGVYLSLHELPQRGEFMSVDAFVVRSTATDPVLKETCSDAFIAAYNTVEVQGFSELHCDFLERPHSWALAFAYMLRVLYPNG